MAPRLGIRGGRTKALRNRRVGCCAPRWGRGLPQQAPLENMGTEEGGTSALLCVELREAGIAGAKPGAEEGLAWATLDVSKSAITTRDNVQLEM